MIKRLFIRFTLIIIFLFFSSASFAQIDIQTLTPPPDSSSPPPASQFQPGGTRPVPQSGGTGRPPNCVNHGRLTNKFSVGGITYGQGKDGEWYAKGGKVTAEDVFNQINEIVDRTGITVDPNREYAGAGQNAEEVLRREIDIQNSDEVCDGIRLTGSSPSIFVYSTNTIVKPIVPILYLENNDRYLYYEYDSTGITFNKPNYGWIIEKNSLSDFTNKIANELKLSKLEKERLLFELNFSAVNVKSDKLFIGLISQEEVDKNIPLKIISPNNPKVIRHHFYVAEAKNKDVKPPILNPIQRAESLILELGSWLEK